MIDQFSSSNHEKNSWSYKHFINYVTRQHCVKSVQIQSFFWSVFSPNTGKYRPSKTSYLDTFHTVQRAYLGKMCIHFLELLFLKFNENVAFSLKISIIRKSVPFCLKVIFFVTFSGCPYFLNKAQDKIYSKPLRSYDPANWKKFVNLKKVRNSCSTPCSTYLFIIATSSHNHKERKQPKIIFLWYGCSVTMIKIFVKKISWTKHLDRYFWWFLVTGTKQIRFEEWPVAEYKLVAASALSFSSAYKASIFRILTRYPPYVF